jgi:hypothetical protein
MFSSLSAGRHGWAWNGRRNNGRLAPPGRYTVSLTGRSVYGNVKTVKRVVQLATRWRTKTVTDRKYGTQTLTRRHSSDCYVNGYSDGSLVLDCWGGRYARAGYHFHMHSHAFNISSRVSGYQGCCSEGQIIRDGRRTDNDSYSMVVKITNWRSYTVNAVRLTYSYKYRI